MSKKKKSHKKAASKQPAASTSPAAAESAPAANGGGEAERTAAEAKTPFPGVHPASGASAAAAEGAPAAATANGGGAAERTAAEVLDHYVRQWQERTGGKTGWLYRGQANETWELESTASRRFKNLPEKLSQERLFEYVEQLLKPVRKTRQDRPDGGIQSELELLARLQHHGAATCLLDFTADFLIALWFACEEQEEEEEEEKDKDKDKTKEKTNGKVFFLSPDTHVEMPDWAELDERDLGENSTLKMMFKENPQSDNKGTPSPSDPKGFSLPSMPKFQKWFWRWEPSHLSPRIFAQQGWFVFCDPEYEKSLDERLKPFSLTIKKKDKLSIRKALKSICGIDQERLFPDFDGYARANSVNSPLSDSRTAEEWARESADHLKRNEDTEALGKINKAIKIDPGNAIYYSIRGVLKRRSKDIEGAIQDHDESIRLKSDNPSLYITRGMTRLQQNKYESAIEDFNTAIKIQPDLEEVYDLLGFAKIGLKDWDGAIEDLRKGKHTTPARSNQIRDILAFAYISRAQEKFNQDRYEESIQDLNKAIELDGKQAATYAIRARLYHELKNTEKRDADAATARKLGWQEKFPWEE